MAASTSSRNGAAWRLRSLKMSWLSTLSMARIRSGRSGWPRPVSCSTKHGWVRRSVVMALSPGQKKADAGNGEPEANLLGRSGQRQSAGGAGGKPDPHQIGRPRGPVTVPSGPPIVLEPGQNIAGISIRREHRVKHLRDAAIVDHHRQALE